MSNLLWRQLVLEFTAADEAAAVAVRHLGPALLEAEKRGDVTAWFFIRKGHQWRLRYQPVGPSPAMPPTLHECLTSLHAEGSIRPAAENEYEPEVSAFGGNEGIATAHRLWHADCRSLLADPDTAGGLGNARITELSMVMISAMLRAAGLDWYEQGDVWDRVSAHRYQPDAAPTRSAEAAVHRLMAVDLDMITRLGGALAPHQALIGEYQRAGSELGALYWAGRLTRGLRAVLAHHVVFAWNHRGLPGQKQGLLAATARNVVFGPPVDSVSSKKQVTHDPALTKLRSP